MESKMVICPEVNTCHHVKVLGHCFEPIDGFNHAVPHEPHWCGGGGCPACLPVEPAQPQVVCLEETHSPVCDGKGAFCRDCSAQPELPRELPHRPAQCQAIYQQALALFKATDDEADILADRLEDALSRIEELESIVIDGCQKGMPCAWLKRIQKLEKLLDEVSYKYKDTFKQLDESMTITYALEQQLAQAETRAEVATGAYNTIYEREASLKEQLAVFMDKIPEGGHCLVASYNYCRFLLGDTCIVTERDLVWDRKTKDYLKHPSCPKYKAPGCPVPAKEEEKP